MIIMKQKHGSALIVFLKKTLLKREQSNHVAARIGLTPSTFSSYMTERACMSYKLIQHLIKEFDLHRTDVLVMSYGFDNCILNNLFNDEEKLEAAQRQYDRLKLHLAIHEKEPESVSAETDVFDNVLPVLPTIEAL